MDYNIYRNDYNNALDDYVQALKRLMKEKKAKGEQITTRDLDKLRQELRYN